MQTLDHSGANKGEVKGANGVLNRENTDAPYFVARLDRDRPAMVRRAGGQFGQVALPREGAGGVSWRGLSGSLDYVVSLDRRPLRMKSVVSVNAAGSGNRTCHPHRHGRSNLVAIWHQDSAGIDRGRRGGVCAN